MHLITLMVDTFHLGATVQGPGMINVCSSAGKAYRYNKGNRAPLVLLDTRSSTVISVLRKV